VDCPSFREAYRLFATSESEGEIEGASPDN